MMHLFVVTGLLITSLLTANQKSITAHDIHTEYQELMRPENYGGKRKALQSSNLQRIARYVDALLAVDQSTNILERIKQYLFFGSCYTAFELGTDLMLAEKEHVPQLHALVESLAKKLGIPTPRIFIPIHTPLYTACSNATDRNTSLIVFDEVSLCSLSIEELKALIGHELGHIYHGDSTSTALISTSLLGIVPIVLTCLLLGINYTTIRHTLIALSYNSGWLCTVAAIDIAVIVALLHIMNKYFMQPQEFAADKISVELTGNTTASVSVLQTLGRAYADKRAQELTFINDHITKIEQSHPHIALLLKKIINRNALDIGLEFNEHPSDAQRAAALQEVLLNSATNRVENPK